MAVNLNVFRFEVREFCVCHNQGRYQELLNVGVEKRVKYSGVYLSRRSIRTQHDICTTNIVQPCPSRQPFPLPLTVMISLPTVDGTLILDD